MMRTRLTKRGLVLLVQTHGVKNGILLVEGQTALFADMNFNSLTRLVVNHRRKGTIDRLAKQM
ncbi:hypothetical protein NKJ50_09785 [Mesorhizobium sp. M0115]|uniref:hypothetical protein n=1 Tax=Mesorhizobium sp. M0115 TaxID=2956883 RepID=UPI003336F2F8